MTLAIVTTFSPKGYEVYGRRFLETLGKHWPAPVYAFHEGERPADAATWVWWNSLDADKDRAAFMASHSDVGFEHDYRKRAVQYSHKVWAMSAAPRQTDHLIWIDADCEVVADVAPEHVAALCGDASQAGSFLARPYHRHTETGFLTFNLKTCGGAVLDAMRDMYVSGDVFKLPEWHDCMVFDAVRKRFERQGERWKNLCPNARGLSVFPQSPLKDLIRHNKGPDAKERIYGDRMEAA
jgi:hypothetical protein